MDGEGQGFEVELAAVIRGAFCKGGYIFRKKTGKKSFLAREATRNFGLEAVEW